MNFDLRERVNMTNFLISLGVTERRADLERLFKKITTVKVFPFVLLRTKALVLELLAAVCLVRGGHDIILSAFDNFKEVF